MDLITYTPNITQLRLDIAAIANAVADPDNPHPAQRICSDDTESGIRLLLTKILTIKNGNASVSLVRGIPETVIESITSMEVIGWIENSEYKFKSGGQAKYESVYNTTERSYVDDDGNSQAYLPPYKIGGFA